MPKPGGGAARRALLRWVPRSQQPDGSIPPLEDVPGTLAELPHLFDLPADEAASRLFEDQEERIVAVWLDAGDAAPKPKDRAWLLFRGAFLFEQYRLPSGLPDPGLDLQWPLVERCEYRKGQAVFSSLGICHEAKPLLYFNFHLPFPVRRTSHSGGPSLNPRAFPFSAVFDLTRTDARPLRIDTLVAGWKAGDALPDLNKPEATCFPFDDEKTPETMELGAFGFAEFGEIARTEFAVFKKKDETTHDYWPLNRQALVQDILWPYGFALDYGFTTWLGPTNLGLADSSLRFVKPADGGKGERSRRSALVYRASVHPEPGTVSQDARADVQSDGTRMRIRLRQELGGRIATGTQFGAGKTPDQELAERIEGWLGIGDTLSADCELSWEIAPKDIWTDDRDADWSLRIAVRLHWLEAVSPGDVAPKAAGSADFRAGLLAQANFSFVAVRDGLEPGEAGQPHSFLPKLSGRKPASVRFALYGSPLPARFVAGGLAWGRAAPGAKGTLPRWQRAPMRLSLAHPTLRHLIEDAGEFATSTLQLDLDGTAPTFFQTPRTGLVVSLKHDESWPPENADTVENGPPFFTSFAIEAHATAAWQGRLASLQFSGRPGRQSVMQSGHLRIGGRGVRLGLGDGAPVLAYPGGRAAAEISLRLAAAGVTPVGVDVGRSDRSGRPAPLLIPLDPATGDPAADPNVLWLIATETISPTQDRELRAAVSENAQETGTRSYVVLSSEPFSIFRFTHQPLHGRGQDDTAYVAFYSGDDRIWQYRRVADFYHYVLPPQAVGESADKPRRLEIHDLKPDASLAQPPRPFVPEFDDDGRPLPKQSGLRRRAVEFRLTPSAEFWIRPSDVERGYFMPESASHDIFRQAGAFGLGAALGYLRAEFLYGMPVGIDVSRERSVARGARVAEIEALTGRLVGPAQQTDAQRSVANRWNALRAAVARRPERLEIWARDFDSAVDFAPARFSDGVQFALRHSALHRAPVIEQPESAADHAALPRIAGFEAGKVPPALASHPRHHPQGLSGGALWPVESLNLFRALLQAPQSNGGTIESIALAPDGGDATQKAEFLGGKVTIVSETRNGHVQRQQVEVLGRIGAFWHRARHVVVYERTANPSAQFAPAKEDDPERTRSRRPILRKVSEYIELLQPERSYPDFRTAARRSSGCLERVRFNSKIIHVDSAWASEVGDDGWEIPLWNRFAARERPQVYAMPDIAFVCAAEGDGDRPVVAQECLDPDYLLFFADFSRDTTSDTDTWAPRLNLDYPNMPAASAIAARVDKASSEPPGEERGHEKRRRAVGRILPGLRRFTWRLAPAAQKVAINAGRAVTPIYAGLDSVTFMRATHAAAAHADLPDKHPLAAALETSAAFPPSGCDSAILAKRPYWDSKGANAGFPEGEQFSARVDALRAALRPKNGGDAGDLKILNDARRALGAHWDAGFKVKLKERIPCDLTEQDFEGFTSALKAGPAFCDRLKSDAVGMIQRKEMLIRSALQDWVAQADEFVNEATLFAKGATKDRAIEELTDRAVAHVRPLFEEASRDIGRIGEGVEKSRATLIDAENEIEAVIARARSRIRQFVKGYDDSKPWSQERRRAFRAGLEACVSNIGDDIAAAIDEARQRLAVELNDVNQTIGGHVARALRQAVSLEAGTLDNVSTIHRAVDRLLASLEDTLARLLQGLPGERLDDLIAQIEAACKDGKISEPLANDAIAAVSALASACEDARTAIDTARDRARALDAGAEQAASEIKAAVQAVTAAVKDVGAVLVRQVQGLVDIISRLGNEGAHDLRGAVETVFDELDAEIAAVVAWPDRWLAGIGSQIDAMVQPAVRTLDALLADLKRKLHGIPASVLPVVEDAKAALATVREALGPTRLLETAFRTQVVARALASVLAPLPARIDGGAVEQALADIKAQLHVLNEAIGENIRSLTESALAGADEVTRACRQTFEGAAEVEAYFNELAKGARAYFDKKLDAARRALADQLGEFDTDLPQFPRNAAELIGTVESFDRAVRGLHNDLCRAPESARMYAERVFDQFGRLDQGGLLAAPSNVLKLYSAVTSAPEIAALKADIDRIRSSFDEFSDIVETTRANALFNRLGDELKALGLSIPFDRIGERLLPNFDDCEIAKVFRSFGARLDDMLKGYRIPSGVADAVRITHDFEKAQARAWVQIDIDAPMPGRRSLFSVGIFKADFVDMRLGGKVRLEASKDDEKVAETGHGRIDAAIDLVVGGQSMVRFETFALNFTREKGLEIEFDPKNVRLNPQFRFIQDFLSTLFPGDVGGLQAIKQNGVPVGVQHDYAIPPLALNFGTSGVSNISIENHFKLVAFPDFMLANRFNLSTVERPFIFSIFIIGGTGYVRIEAEYRPFDNELAVIVEAGAGGSASLAFAVGPFSGQVFITLSGTLAYRKMIGRAGGGLSISVVLVIAGHVNVAGIATVGIVLMLRMTYRDDGQIDGDGSLSVTIRISRFFELTARANATYKLRGGKSETTLSGDVSGKAADKLDEKVKALRKAAARLENART